MSMSRRKSSTCAALLGLLTPGLVQGAPVDNPASQAASSCSGLAQVTAALGSYPSANAVCSQMLGEEVTTVTSTKDGSQTSTKAVPVTTGTVTITVPAETISA